MQTTPSHYRSFLLRIWQAEKTRCDRGWQASLQTATTSQPMGFADLEELFVFLINTMEAGVIDGADSFGQDEQDLQDKRRVSSC